ncbi:MAG: ribose-5-phosphate isomerase RpiA [Deinococcota bacterium]
MSIDDLKRAAAEKAAHHVQPGMKLGLGSGSTAKHAIDVIGERFQKGELAGIQAVATSNASDAQARALGIPMMPFEGGLDLAIDGMDELTPQLDAIKGLGGALTREKIVEARADLLILIADDSKKVTTLGEKSPLPIEVIPLAEAVVTRELEQLGATVSLRTHDDAPFITDNHNIILDCRWQTWQPHDLAPIITAIPGVVEHGLFLGMAKLAYLASEDSVIELEPREAWS